MATMAGKTMKHLTRFLPTQIAAALSPDRSVAGFVEEIKVCLLVSQPVPSA